MPVVMFPVRMFSMRLVRLVEGRVPCCTPVQSTSIKMLQLDLLQSRD